MQSFLTIPLIALALVLSVPKKNIPVTVPEKGWTSLFDGKTLKGWHIYGHRPMNDSWTVQDGTIFFDKTKKAFMSQSGCNPGGNLYVSQSNLCDYWGESR